MDKRENADGDNWTVYEATEAYQKLQDHVGEQ